MYYALLHDDGHCIAIAPSINKLKAAILEGYGTEAASLGDITVAQKVSTLRVVNKAAFEEVKGK